MNLSLKPIKNNRIVWHEHDGEVVLLVKNRGIFNRVLQLLKTKPETSYIHLDEIGSYVWKIIDGEKTVFEIGKELENKFSRKAFPVYERLTYFLGTLRESKLIIF